MSFYFRSLFVSLFFLTLHGSSHAQILLIIDVSDIHNITFTATGAFPLIDDNSFNGEDGFTMIGLLADLTDSQMYLDGSSNLKASGVQPYDEIIGVNFASTDTVSFEPGYDLWMFRYLETDAQNFSIHLAAFTGMASVDLFGNNIVLKTSGGGDI